MSISSLLRIGHHISSLKNWFLNCIYSLNKLNGVSWNCLIWDELRILFFWHSLMIFALIFSWMLSVDKFLHKHVILGWRLKIVLNWSLNMLHRQSAFWGNRVQPMLFLTICALIRTKVVLLAVSHYWCFYWSWNYLNVRLIGNLLEFETSLISCLMKLFWRYCLCHHHRLFDVLFLNLILLCSSTARNIALILQLHRIGFEILRNTFSLF